MQNDRFLLKQLEDEIELNLDMNKFYSVRSSASIEDMPSHSFAGQFKSFLNVKGKSNILESIKKVWESTNTDNIKSYLRKSKIDQKNLKMAVIIQEMVKAKSSGVTFTKNPMNNRDEIIIEAVKGLGDSLLQDGVNPYRGVYKLGTWVEKPDLPGMPIKLLEDIVIESKILENKKGKPLNLEWSYDGHYIYWLQLREITALSNLPFYSNKMAKEFLPGIIKPLICTICSSSTYAIVFVSPLFA